MWFNKLIKKQITVLACQIGATIHTSLNIVDLIHSKTYERRPKLWNSLWGRGSIQKNTLSTATVTCNLGTSHVFKPLISEPKSTFLSVYTSRISWSHHFPNQHVHANTARAFHAILVPYSMRHVFRGDINVFHNFITNQKWSLRAIRNICWDFPAAMQHFRFSYTEKYLEVPPTQIFIFIY